MTAADLVEPIWERQPKEKATEYNKFGAYLACSPVYGRKLEHAAKIVKQKYSDEQWRDLAVKWQWKKRAHAYDCYLHEQRVLSATLPVTHMRRPAQAAGKLSCLPRVVRRPNAATEQAEQELRNLRANQDAYIQASEEVLAVADRLIASCGMEVTNPDGTTTWIPGDESQYPGDDAMDLACGKLEAAGEKLRAS